MYTPVTGVTEPPPAPLTLIRLQFQMDSLVVDVKLGFSVHARENATAARALHQVFARNGGYPESPED